MGFDMVKFYEWVRDTPEGQKRMQEAFQDTLQRVKEGAAGGIVRPAPIILGDDSPELVTVPEGAQVMPMPFKHIRCDGPDCPEETLTLSPAAGWRTVTGPYHIPAYEVHNFCTLRCLANWLAVELAKEEKASNQ